MVRSSRQYTQRIVYGTAIALSVLMLLLSTVIVPRVNAATVTTQFDCDTNAVLTCGGATTTEIHSKYKKSPDAQAIYAYFGISDWHMKNLTKNAVVGKVTTGGRVLVDGKEVATGVVTVGRINMAGSETVTHDGTTFYVRPPSASFQQQSLPAFVVLNKDGTMKHAIIASCGNPVMVEEEIVTETPKPEQPQPEAPKPAPQAQAPTATAVATNITNVNVQQQQQQQQAPPAPTPPTPQPVTPQPVAVTPVATLPKTGAAQVLQLVALTSIGATIAHMLYARRKQRYLDI